MHALQPEEDSDEHFLHRLLACEKFTDFRVIHSAYFQKNTFIRVTYGPT